MSVRIALALTLALAACCAGLVGGPLVHVLAGGPDTGAIYTERPAAPAASMPAQPPRLLAFGVASFAEAASASSRLIALVLVPLLVSALAARFSIPLRI